MKRFLDADAAIHGNADMKGRSTAKDRIGVKNLDADAAIHGNADLIARSPFPGRIGVKNREILFLFGFLLAFLLGDYVRADDFQAIIEADWARQESHKGRGIDDPNAIREHLTKAERLLNAMTEMPNPVDLSQERRLLEEYGIAASSPEIELADHRQRVELYLNVRMLIRSMMIKNPLVADQEILFLKRKRFVCQFFHEFQAYYPDLAGQYGGGLYVLEKPGLSDQVRPLTEETLTPGNFVSLALSYDAKKAYFAYAAHVEKERPEGVEPNWRSIATFPEYSAGQPYYQNDRVSYDLYAIDLDDGQIDQLTDSIKDDFEPCPMPNGDLVFVSTRRGGYVRCNSHYEPLESWTLHRLPQGEKQVQTVSFHETSEWGPSVLNDGQLLYIRWDYVDRSAAHHHGPWTSRPDGTNPRALFGNMTYNISACYQPRPIPGSQKIAMIIGAHHSHTGGTLALLDPKKISLDPETGEDEFDSLEILTPEVGLAEAPNHWPETFYLSPWPLSEDYFLVSYSHDPMPGMGPGITEDSLTGIYYYDRFGNLELLYRDEEISSSDPILLAPRATPPILASTRSEQLAAENMGTYLLSNVYESHLPLPKDRPVKELRIWQILPKEGHFQANNPRIGHANAESARMLLGTVPVESDGSAYFKAPAKLPLYFQALDENGLAVQGMRSATYLQPGEQASCIGCHESPQSVVVARISEAASREASTIQPGPEAAHPMSFMRLVQPILDQRCVTCHGKDDPLSLTPEPTGSFNQAYDSLRPHLRWYEWGSKSITQTVTFPGRCGADESPLLEILQDDNHKTVDLSEDELHRMIIWLDGNVPFYGTYAEDSQRSQRLGQAVEPPALQ